MTNVAALQSAAGPQQVAQPAPVGHHVSFHDVLSLLNPLQYLPVIGTIYRAVTGDQIPEAARRIGSFVASALLGGPIGAAINVALMVAEKITGIDLDHTGQTLLTGIGQGDHPVGHPVPAPSPAPVAPADAAAPPATSAVQAWSPAQRAAYGISAAGDRGPNLADVSADMLNAFELLRIQGARAAYGRAVSLAG
ncbi:MAG: hypothetical protein ABSC95_31610 [Acetobacteraceae bacterium]|jgi:hypothetical protein